MSTLDPDSLSSDLNHFLNRAPHIIRRYTSDHEQANRIENIDAQDESPFTMAIVGQMRSGKSTLINSMIDDDDVTTVGVTETTATVNWIRHGDAAQRQMFRVTWNESPQRTEELPRSDLARWSGDSHLAANTRYLELFSTSEFLKNVVIVDTPGSRSTIESHQETLENFLSARNRCEDETLYYGGKADCLVYVLPATARQSDSELLQSFSHETRIPGSSVFNSIGVLHKWEAMISTETPWIDAQRKAQTIRSQLKNYLSDVIPVSGPLHRLCQRMPDTFWQNVLHLATSCQPSTFKRLLMQRPIHSSELESLGAHEDPMELFAQSQLPWSCFKVVLQYARNTKKASALELKSEIRQLAGVDLLMEQLASRFFSRSKAIRASTRLRKALQPCDQVIHSMRTTLYHSLKRKKVIDKALGELATIEHSLPNCRQFLTTEREYLLDITLPNLERGLNELEIASMNLRTRYLRFDQDLQTIQHLDENPGLFTDLENHEVFSLMGAYGNRLDQRCSVYPNWEQNPNILEERLIYWIGRFETALGTERTILGSVVQRLDEILGYAFPDLHLQES